MSRMGYARWLGGVFACCCSVLDDFLSLLPDCRPVVCSGQVISDTSIGFFAAISFS
jgi:hypothetical protein